ncbi:hypothetical protein EJ05DRAFT_497478 [Pseudovirgaria hyperparasitica]|uniref:CBM1 domain-containing protein n=1 Tax=Pseudovirgaria hyperparasitica TaxID=470096 RepID=A0A6A6WGY8_9PEZI|nr:uncharacterized protein EJ05DRAFT_497478 [Pseudovirgaria hyperparasitica]KAF2760907.1 hypothetical protein EJ05DRAFT_497478 [Pseudovirgaria hyperparasitica]
MQSFTILTAIIASLLGTAVAVPAPQFPGFPGTPATSAAPAPTGGVCFDDFDCFGFPQGGKCVKDSSGFLGHCEKQ